MYCFYRKSNRGMEFVRCTEVVCLSESPLVEVSLYCGVGFLPILDLLSVAFLFLLQYDGCPGDGSHMMIQAPGWPARLS